MLLSTLLCSALLACGGGGGGDAATDTESLESAASRLALNLPRPAAEPAAAPGAASAPMVAPTTTAAGDLLQAPAALASAAGLRTLAGSTGDAGALLRMIGATPQCRAAFIAPASLVQAQAAALPDSGGAFFNAQELATWRARVASGPFLVDGDYAARSPGDWARIRRNAETFKATGDTLTATDPGSRSMHGNLARDAAFYHLITQDAATLVAVRQWLLREVALPANDFATTLCYEDLNHLSRDGWFAEAPWFARLLASYDFVRRSLTADDRRVIDNYIRRNAYFFAAHVDWGMDLIFPRRLSGDYSSRTGDAALTGNAVWMSQRLDTNGDCRIDDADEARSFPAYAYVRGDGTPGPRLTQLGLWFNNRKSANALAFGIAAVLLGDAELAGRSKRYVMEWLTYSVFADGSQGEYERNGNYCVPRQGVIYGSLNLQTGLMLARLLARQGDPSLAQFETRDGLAGSQSAAEAPAKSLALVAQTYLRLSNRELPWYQFEAHKSTQAPREATHLGRMELSYLGSGAAVDDFHELTMLASAAAVPAVPVAAVLMRLPAATSQRWPGAQGQRVSTGLGEWTDAFGILPAAYLLRP